MPTLGNAEFGEEDDERRSVISDDRPYDERDSYDTGDSLLQSTVSPQQDVRRSSRFLKLTTLVKVFIFVLPSTLVAVALINWRVCTLILASLLPVALILGAVARCS